jgi:hypothetical protein
MRFLIILLLPFNFPLLGQLPDLAKASLCEITTTNFVTQAEGAGTGVVIREDDGAYLYSNAHVLLGGSLKVKNLLGETLKLGDPQMLEDRRDMIRFKVDSKFGFKIGELPEAGSAIFSYGNAGGGGIISKNGVFLGVGENLDLIHSIPIVGGDSGGPIFNQKSEVIGINWGGPINSPKKKGASFLNLKWIQKSFEMFNAQSRNVALVQSKVSFWWNQCNKVTSPDFILSTRAEWLPKMQKMVNITDRKRVSEAYKLKPMSQTYGAVSLEDHFHSSIELLYSFLPVPLEIQKTTAALIKFYIDKELEKVSRLTESLPINSWLKHNYSSWAEDNYKNLKSKLERFEGSGSNHDLSLFTDSVNSKKFIKIEGELVPVISLPMLGRFWDAFYKKFYNGKDFGRGRGIDPNLYLGPAYLHQVCSHQWVNGNYKRGIMNRGKASTVLTRTALMHMYSKIDRIEFDPNKWRPEWDEKLKKGIRDGHINGMTIPEFIRSVSSVIQQNMLIKAEEYMIEAQSEAQLALWVSFATGKEVMPLSKVKTINNFTYSKDSKLIKGIDLIDPENRPKYSYPGRY